MYNPLIKYNKLKRFSAYVHDTIRHEVEKQFPRIDCLTNGDIYTRRDMWEKMDAIADCASLVELRKYETGETVIHNANYCHNPVVCPICADRVSKRRKAIFDEPIRRAVRRFAVDKCCGDWKSDYPEQYTGVYMATATIKTNDNLKERIDHLLDSSKRMRKMGQKRKAKRSQGEWSKVRAGISNVEIKIGTGSNKWHVHSHFLIFTDSPIDINNKNSNYIYNTENKNAYCVAPGTELKSNEKRISKWNYEWYLSTKGEAINFDLRPVQFLKNVHGKKCETMEESVRAQAAEIIKYSALLNEKKGAGLLSAAQYVELIQRRGNRRLFNTIGLMRCDKRNPESLMTVTERELKKLEYVESLDNKHYEIFASLWQNGGTYGEMAKQDGALFSSSDDMKTKFVNIRRRAFLAQTAKYQGEYRKARNDHFNNRVSIDSLNHTTIGEYFEAAFSMKNSFENTLDQLRDSFRNKVKTLWEKYNDMNFLPEFLTEFDSGGMAEFKALHLPA